jgi:two-component system chemotaxis response regulator CheY
MRSVLIVDDSRTSRKILRTILEQHGYNIVGEAGDGE